MKAIYNIVQKISNILGKISALVIFLMMLFMVADIVLRFTINRPIIGSYEIVEQMMVILVFFAFAHTQIKKGHIAVDIVTSAVPRKVRDIMNVITACLSTIIIGIVSYATFQQILTEIAKKSTTSTLLIPIYPFSAVVFIGVLFLGLCMLLDMITAIADLLGKEDLKFSE